MKISPKHVLVALTFLAAAAVVAIFTLGVLAHKHRGQVQQELQTLLGKDVTFDAVETSLWGVIGFTVKEFRIADNPQFAATPFLQARELRLGVSLWHLFLGRLVVDSLIFSEPEFQIITNEEGLLNVTELTNRKKELASFPRLRAGSTERRNALVSFLITRIKVAGGRVDFVDRSVNPPADLKIKNIELDVGGLDLAARAKIKLAASLTEELERDLRIEGEVGPPALGKNWSQQPVNLEMQFDSLYLPTLARAVPFLRDRIPRELDITGPMYFQARLSGTLQQPGFTRIILKVPFLGSSDYNAILEGKAEFNRLRDWAEAPIAGNLTLNAISLAQLRKLPLLGQILPADFATGGSVNLHSRFEGTWNRLRLGAFLEADNSNVRYPGWFDKPVGAPAEIRAQISRHNGDYTLHPSELNLGKTKILVSGALTQGQEPRISLKLSAGNGPLKTFEQLLTPAPFDAVAGEIGWDILFDKNTTSPAGGWEIGGNLNLAQVALRHKASGTKIDQLNGSVSFSGRRARAQNLSFRLGSSAVNIILDVTELNPLSGRYALRSADLNLADIPPFIDAAARMKDILARGGISLENELPRLQGILSSSEGTFHDVPYRKLQSEVMWSPTGVNFKDLRTRVFGGELRADGSWSLNSGQARSFSLAPRLAGLSVNGVLAHLAPELKDRFEGQLDFHGEFDSSAPPDGSLRQMLKGSGGAVIRKGRIKDFNLIARLFFRSSSPEQSAKAAQQLPRDLAAIVQRDDTPVEDFKATLALEAQRIRSDNLLLSTPEYVISAAGWIGFDGATQWDGLLVFSPKVTQELQREYGAIRYFLDRKKRLAVSFRIDGKLPNVRIRPVNRALAQALRWGTWQRGDEVTGRGKRSGKNWLPESLDRLLHR